MSIDYHIAQNLSGQNFWWITALNNIGGETLGDWLICTAL